MRTTNITMLRLLANPSRVLNLLYSHVYYDCGAFTEWYYFFLNFGQ